MVKVFTYWVSEGYFVLLTKIKNKKVGLLSKSTNPHYECTSLQVASPTKVCKH